MRRLLLLVALVPILLADTCDQNACNRPPTEVGGQVTVAQAAGDSCAGRPPDHIIAWFSRQGTQYPLRCGRRDPRGYGYLHIRYDEGGHGDPLNDPTFRAEVATPSNTARSDSPAVGPGGTP